MVHPWYIHFLYYIEIILGLILCFCTTKLIMREQNDDEKVGDGK